MNQFIQPGNMVELLDSAAQIENILANAPARFCAIMEMSPRAGNTGDLGQPRVSRITMSDYITTATCTKCGVEKPLTSEFFHPSKTCKTGFAGDCRDCRSNYRKAYYRNNRDRELEYVKHFRAENPDVVEKAREASKRWRETNPEKAREKSKRWREANPEKRRESSLRWQRENPEKQRESNKRWRQANPDKEKAKEHRRRARKQGLPNSFTGEAWSTALEYFEHRCAVCGRPAGLWHTLAADHWIPLTAPNCPGTIPSNIVPLCHGDGGCNNSKHNRDAQEWLTAKFGKRKATAIFARIEAYFDFVIGRESLTTGGAS